MTNSCRTCGYGFVREDNNLICCGAPVDDDALRGEEGDNPIWAIRKYSEVAIVLMLTDNPPLEGIDCENMDPDDGVDCELYRSHDTNNVLSKLKDAEKQLVDVLTQRGVINNDH